LEATLKDSSAGATGRTLGARLWGAIEVAVDAIGFFNLHGVSHRRDESQEANEKNKGSFGVHVVVVDVALC
jgi:hypothetical protein